MPCLSNHEDGPMLPIIRAAGALCLLASACAAQAIYPIDRAEILAGSRFDLKVEFPGAVPPADIKVTINGEDAAKVLGRDAQIDSDEDGLGHTAYWIRSVELPKAGSYAVLATDGKNSRQVEWQAFAGAKRAAKNVILLIGDGMSMAHRTGARMLSKGIHEGKYGGELAMDDMPHMALVSTSGTDSIVTDSANAMSAYTTGHKTCVNALGVYCARNRSTLGHPNVETIAELAKRKLGMALGIVTDAEVEDATPAGMVAHTRRRSDYDDIVRMLYWLKPDVVLGGGSLNFLPAAADGRGKRKDGEDYVAKFQKAGYAFAANETELAAVAAKPETTKLLGLFNEKNIDGALDRKFLRKGTVAKFPDQPDLTEQTRAALEVLSRSKDGFLLMVEAGRIDKYSHSLDWERAVYDTIMFDNVVKIAKDFAAKQDDTLVIVVPDHAHPVSIIGTYDDTQGEQLRDRLQTYAEAGFPAYPAPDKDGYPDKVDVTRRLAMVFAAYPDYCDPGRPYLDGENEPTVAGPLPSAVPAAPVIPAAGSNVPPTTTQAVVQPPARPALSKDQEPKPPAIANEVYCKPGAARKIGNLPFTARNGVHAADDVVLTATGPGAEILRGRIDNTFVFRAMAQALGLGP
jgi:alkaline phosphatase